MAMQRSGAQLLRHLMALSSVRRPGGTFVVQQPCLRLGRGRAQKMLDFRVWRLIEGARPRWRVSVAKSRRRFSQVRESSPPANVALLLGGRHGVARQAEPEQ